MPFRALSAALLLVPRLAAAQASFESEVELSVPAFAASLSAAKAAPQAPARVDLSYQFGPGRRVQGGLNSCHAFVAVALIEAAYFRTYGRHVRLSEADLFLATNALPVFPFLRAFEGGLARPHLRRALARGVLPGDHYAAFEERWGAFKKRFFKFLDSRNSVAAELLPESLAPEAEESRGKIRSEIAGFAVGGESFFSFIGANARSIAKKDRVRCSVERRERMLLRQLDAGRPVAVGLHTGWSGDPAWRRDAAGEGGSHYFVVVGYERDESGGVVFKTRNTWSNGLDPDLSGRDLCEVYGMTWLRSPNDAR